MNTKVNAEFLRNRLLLIMGKSSRFRTNVRLSSNQIITLLISQLESYENSRKLYTKIYSAFQSMCKYYCTSGDPMVEKKGYGEWCLTPSGVIAARSLRRAEALHRLVDRAMALPSVESLASLCQTPSEAKCRQFVAQVPAENLTSKWLAANWDALYEYVKVGLRKAYPTETESNIEDGVMTYFLKAIEKDSYRKVLATGEEPKFSHVSWFARNKYVDILRKDSGNPVRKAQGITTRSERKKAEANPLSVSVGIRENSVVRENTEDSYYGNGILDFVSEDISPEDHVIHESVMGNLEEVLEQSLEDSAREYINIFRALSEGASIKEIAEEEQLDKQAVNRMAGKIKRRLQKARSYGQLDYV